MDREKIIKGLYAHGYRDCKSCPYWGTGDNGMSACRQLAREAYALLKEQDNCENCAIAIEDRQLVVRCKDCKWYSPEISRCSNSMFPREQTFFCADGRRR